MVLSNIGIVLLLHFDLLVVGKTCCFLGGEIRFFLKLSRYYITPRVYFILRVRTAHCFLFLFTALV